MGGWEASQGRPESQQVTAMTLETGGNSPEEGRGVELQFYSGHRCPIAAGLPSLVCRTRSAQAGVDGLGH